MNNSYRLARGRFLPSSNPRGSLFPAGIGYNVESLNGRPEISTFTLEWP